jgi:hypothetical protein
MRDLPGRGRRRSIMEEDKTWIYAPAGQAHPEALCGGGTPAVAMAGARDGFPDLVGAVKPHKIQYYLERRDPEFKAKMIEVLHVYRDVELWRKAGLPAEVVGVLSYRSAQVIFWHGHTQGHCFRACKENTHAGRAAEKNMRTG